VPDPPPFPELLNVRVPPTDPADPVILIFQVPLAPVPIKVGEYILKLFV